MAIAKAMKEKTPAPPADLPRLPAYLTLANTLLLLASSVVLATGLKREGGPAVLAAAGMGALFLAVQSVEWLRMLTWDGAHGTYGGMFFALIGTHAAHVLGGAVALFWAGLTARPGDGRMRLRVCGLYWYFVLAVWPVIYGIIYH